MHLIFTHKLSFVVLVYMTLVEKINKKNLYNNIYILPKIRIPPFNCHVVRKYWCPVKKTKQNSSSTQSIVRYISTQSLQAKHTRNRQKKKKSLHF